MPSGANPAEDVVGKVLNKLKEEGLIAGFLQNRQSDRLDEEGIDFLIFLPSGFALPLQVKTCNSNDKRQYDGKLQEHKRKHPLVKFLICVRTNLLANESERLYSIVEKDLRSTMRRVTPL
ncbi:MAG: hypothetical protein Q7S73_01895 [bacterium]|nr:hypothetical protein [bacterium]